MGDEQVEAETFKLDVNFNGIRATLVARLFLDHEGEGNILAVRSLRLLSVGDDPLAEVASGKYPDRKALAADVKAKQNG